MTKKIIAVVKLAPGNIGWYDALTGIHLTLARPTSNDILVVTLPTLQKL